MKTARKVLITGAAGGIGTELVRRFIANGDSVIATDSSADALEILSSVIDARETLTTHVADVTDEAAVSDLIGVAGSDGGQLDVVITCHGYFPIIPFEELTATQYRRIVDINLTGTFLVLHKALPLMRESGWGRIITMSSGTIFEGTPGVLPYVAAKAGVLGLTRSLSREVGHYGITVNTVTPGLTATPVVLENFSAEVLESQVARRAIARDQQASDLVGGVFFLASPEADFISGQILNIDGGYHLN